MRKGLALCPLLLILVFQAAPLGAQAVLGRLVDAAGKPIAGALVTVVNTSGAALRVTVSDGRGGFAIEGAVPGTLQLRIERPGYLPFTSGPITPRPGANDTLPVTVASERWAAPEARAGSGRCTPDSVFDRARELWQQAKVALTVIALAEEFRMLDVRGARYVRVLDSTGMIVIGLFL